MSVFSDIHVERGATCIAYIISVVTNPTEDERPQLWFGATIRGKSEFVVV